VLDVFSRRVVELSMANHLRTELVLNALKMALVPITTEHSLQRHGRRGGASERAVSRRR